MLNDIQAEILRQVADLAALPETGAVNLRSDGQRAFHRDSEHVHIVSKTDKDGIDIHIDPGTKGETVHIPVVITKSGVKDLVYNDFFIGEGAEVKIVAGCGIHNCGGCDSEHDGIHTFHVGKNAKVTYVVEQFEVAHVFHVQAHDLVLGVATGEGGELQHDDEKDAQSHNFFSFSARFTQIAAQVLSFFHTFVKHLDEHLAGTGSIGPAVD